MKVLKNGKGISTPVCMVLTLVCVVFIVQNVFLWNYAMTQYDHERDLERFRISEVRRNREQQYWHLDFDIENEGPNTIHLICIWVINEGGNTHNRYEISIFINSGSRSSVSIPEPIESETPYNIKIFSERGNCVSKFIQI